MPTFVEVPKLGNTVEECLIARWCKRKGDAVAAGDIVAEIETDKATFEVTAPAGGTLLETWFEEGALAPVFAKLFAIGEPGETVGEQTPLPEAAIAPAASLPATLSIERTPEPESGRQRLSPRARRFANQRNFHPDRVHGSGPGGRILERDLRALFDAGTRISGVREKIARRMRESLAATAQYTLHTWADAGAMLALRARLPAGINLNHLVAFCTIETLLEVPALNAEFIDGRLVTHAEVHLGFACDTPRGLLVPVVRHAETLCLDELAAQMKTLAAAAVEGSIGVDDLTGATFTISNLGALGIEAFTPLLNPPQVAILGVGAVHLKPVRRNGGIDFADAIGLSLTCDHQVIDGAPGARFLQVLKRNIESAGSLDTTP